MVGALPIVLYLDDFVLQVEHYGGSLIFCTQNLKKERFQMYNDNMEILATSVFTSLAGGGLGWLAHDFCSKKTHSSQDNQVKRLPVPKMMGSLVEHLLSSLVSTLKIPLSKSASLLA